MINLAISHLLLFYHTYYINYMMKESEKEDTSSNQYLQLLRHTPKSITTQLFAHHT